MKIRELLQIEIWSKRTTRKMLVWFGIVLGVVAVASVVLGAWFAVDSFWVTPHERSVARAALTQVDALRQNEGLSARDFEIRKNLVQGKIEAAQKAAWTDRDRRIASGLSAYLDFIEIDRKDAEVMKEITAKYPARAQKIAASDKEHGIVRGQNTLIFGSILHQMLD